MKHPDFSPLRDLQYANPVTGKLVTVDALTLVSVAKHANSYLHEVDKMCRECAVDLFVLMGQRNISGFVGQVFSHSFAACVTNFKMNPHADGRPDLLDLSTKPSKDHFINKCHEVVGGQVVPQRTLLAPFKFAGLEVKSSIGSPRPSYRSELLRLRGDSSLPVRTPRVSYLGSLNYWAHHTDFTNLLAIYYDYAEWLSGVPQILAAFYSPLNPPTDWNKVSVGKPGSKKTSNTSLTQRGQRKLLKGCLLVSQRAEYAEALRSVGASIP